MIKKKILDTLKSKWRSGLLYFEIFVDLTGKELFNWCEEVNPTKFYNSEKYIDYIDIFFGESG